MVDEIYKVAARVASWSGQSPPASVKAHPAWAVVHGLGANHCMTGSGSVLARKSFPGGALIMRVRTSSRVSGFAVVFMVWVAAIQASVLVKCFVFVFGRPQPSVNDMTNEPS